MIVVDTNVIAYFYLEGEHTATAEKIFKTDSEWAAPVLWKSEFRNILALYLRKASLQLQQALLLFQQAESHLREATFEVPSNQVLALVKNSACSAYDCEFVALAEDLDVPLITFDKKVLQEFPKIAISPKKFTS